MLRQMTFEDESEEYKAFVEKFKPKKTTDDCYTPPEVFDCVAEWAAAERAQLSPKEKAIQDELDRKVKEEESR